jgi:hypothetical protein
MIYLIQKIIIKYCQIFIWATAWLFPNISIIFFSYNSTHLINKQVMISSQWAHSVSSLHELAVRSVWYSYLWGHQVSLWLAHKDKVTVSSPWAHSVSSLHELAVTSVWCSYLWGHQMSLRLAHCDYAISSRLHWVISPRIADY